MYFFWEWSNTWFKIIDKKSFLVSRGRERGSKRDLIEMEEVNGTKVTGSRNELVCDTSSMLEWKKNHLKVVGQRDTSPRKEEEGKWMEAEIPEEEIERKREDTEKKNEGEEREARDVLSRAINFINLASFSLWFPFFFISFSNSWSLPPLFSLSLGFFLTHSLCLGYPLWIFLFFAHPFIPATIQTFFHGWYSLLQSIHYPSGWVDKRKETGRQVLTLLSISHDFALEHLLFLSFSSLHRILWLNKLNGREKEWNGEKVLGTISNAERRNEEEERENTERRNEEERENTERRNEEERESWRTCCNGKRKESISSLWCL